MRKEGILHGEFGRTHLGNSSPDQAFYFFCLKNISFIHFLERSREGEREGEKHQCVVASHASPTGDLVSNPDMCPDWESNWGPFGLQASIQSTEPHQPG